MAVKFIPVRITLPENQYDWVMSRPDINLSGLVQKTISEEMQKTSDPLDGFRKLTEWWMSLSERERSLLCSMR
jgi:hypothetical protein